VVEWPMWEQFRCVACDVCGGRDIDSSVVQSERIVRLHGECGDLFVFVIGGSVHDDAGVLSAVR
jgi:hypothetical protein